MKIEWEQHVAAQAFAPFDLVASCCEAAEGITLPLAVHVVLTDDEEIQRVNAEYRGMDRSTDVLSFPQYDDMEELAYDLGDEEVTALIGDVVICYDRVLSQAEEFGTGVTREFVYLFTHSILHLMGYDHMEEDEKRVMRAREEEILGSIGVNR